MIDVTHLTKVYPATSRDNAPVTALNDVTLHVDRGQVMGIIGPSGSGKTTLGRCLTLLEKPSSGSISVNGVDLTSLTGDALRTQRRRISVIYQDFNLLNSRTAMGNVELPLQLIGVPKAERRERAQALLERVGLSDKASVHPAQLSGGQQQRVAIARALISQPDVLVSDEATSALDPETTQSIIRLLRGLTDEFGLTTLLITHQMEVINQVADAIATIEHGRIAKLETVDRANQTTDSGEQVTP